MRRVDLGHKIGLIALVVIAAVFAWSCVILPRRAFPKTRGTLTVNGLDAPVEIVRDTYGVPHIYAHSPEDLFFAQGYVHAQDRFWQMEFQRRVAGGRLSELFGGKVLDTDIFLRTLGFEHVAEEEYKQLDVAEKRHLDAYVAGVNAYIADRKPGKISLEYALLKLVGTDFEVEEWKPIHTLTWGKLLSWSMSSNLTTEKFLLELLRTVGVPGAEYYYPPYRTDMPFIVSSKEPGLETAFARWLSSAAGSRSEGTNSWVVSGTRSATGQPILANDTHLRVQMPSIWYEIGLHTVDDDGRPIGAESGGIQARGFSSPGHPGVLIGHNVHVAWGVSDFGDDVQDLYVEKINPENPNQYAVNGAWHEMTLRNERIDIQGKEEPFIHIVHSTRHGPIISDRGSYKTMESFGYATSTDFPANLELSAVALRWSSLDPDRFWGCVYRMQNAATIPQFRKALSLARGPVLNFIYADTEGNIGYQTVGRIPIRKKGQGRIPVPGWTDDFEWTGYVPFEERSTLLNPQKGYIVACNNPAAPFDFPYDLGTTWVNGYRARRISDLIEADQDGMSLEDAIRIQADVFDRTASEIIPRLDRLDLAAPPVSPLLKPKQPHSPREQKMREELEARVDATVEEARRTLFEWDKNMNMESTGTAVYALFFQSLTEATFKDQFPYRKWDTEANRRFEGAYVQLMNEPENLWWDDIRTPDIQETRDVILTIALRDAVRTGIQELGERQSVCNHPHYHAPANYRPGGSLQQPPYPRSRTKRSRPEPTLRRFY